jgi:hypothetical protein
MAAKSAEAQALLAGLDADLAASAKHSGRDLVWSAAERDVLSMIGAAVDRRVELSAAYGRSHASCDEVEDRDGVAVDGAGHHQAISASIDRPSAGAVGHIPEGTTCGECSLDSRKDE